MTRSNIRSPGEMNMPTTYDFHGLFHVWIGHGRLNETMKRELWMFEGGTGSLDLRVEEGGVAVPDMQLSYPWDTISYFFDESCFVIQTPLGRIQVTENLLRAEPETSPQMLLDQLVMNIMRKRTIARGATLVHASAVSKDGVGYLFPAWAHSGKTNVALSFLADGYDFMSDDWSFVADSGEILAYPRWLKIFDYNLRCHPFLIETVASPGKRRYLERRLAATEFADGLKPSNRFSRKLRHWISARYGIYFNLPHSIAVPGCNLAMRSSLSKACLLTVVRSDTCEIRAVSPEHLAAKVASCAHFEQGAFLRHSSAIAYAGHWDLPGSLVSEEVDLLTEAFRRARCFEISLPSRYTSSDLDHVRHLVEKA